MRSSPAAPPLPAAPEETGYDLDTGQVLDAAKYAQWQKAQKDVPAQAAAPDCETIYEVFLRASRVIQEWVDRDTTQPLLTYQGLVIRSDPTAQALIASFDQWGKDLVDKLWQRLEFIVQNRRDFKAAR